MIDRDQHVLNPIIERYDFSPGVDGNGVSIEDYHPRKSFVACSCGWGGWIKGWTHIAEDKWVEHFQAIQMASDRIREIVIENAGEQP